MSFSLKNKDVFDFRAGLQSYTLTFGHMLCKQLLWEGGRAFPSCQLSRFVLWEGVLLHLALLQTGGVEHRGSKWAREKRLQKRWGRCLLVLQLSATNTRHLLVGQLGECRASHMMQQQAPDFTEHTSKLMCQQQNAMETITSF